MKTTHLSRRQFIQRSALAASAVAFPFVSARNVLGANNRLDIAGIGVGGKGAVDIDCCSTENIVALCDVDETRGAPSFDRFAKAKRYRDFRIMLDQEAGAIDAVTISTPDHTHAWPALRAMQMGKHVYCQKPLTHTIHEARLLTQAARDYKVVTQMGNQGHSQPDSRRLVEILRAGTLGDLKELHVWTDRPIWHQGGTRPVGSELIPKSIDWDLWLGPAPSRPYHSDYVPFKWRGFWDFGTGALGDMGCHNMDLAYFAFQLRDPVKVDAQSSGTHEDMAPSWSVITYHFPRANGKTLPLTWYDGGKKPSPDLVNETSLPPNGCIFVGSKDTLFVPNFWGSGTFLSGGPMENFKHVPISLPRFPGADKNNDLAHHQEWIAACKGEGHALSNFDYAGPMTEAVLLGNVAVRMGGTLEWDAKSLRVKNNPDANRFIKKKYRKGWELPT